MILHIANLIQDGVSKQILLVLENYILITSPSTFPCRETNPSTFSPSDSHSARREGLYLCDRRSLRIATHTRTHCTRTFINTALAAINPELTNTKPHDSMFVRREHTHALCGGKVFTDQYGPIRQSLAHAYTLSQRSQSLWDSRCWAGSLRLIKTTVRVRVCAYSIRLQSVPPPLYHLS